MAEKSIEMNIKNQENNYDILFPKTKQELVVDLLNDDTKVYIGLSEDATADDAFRSLYLLNILNDKSAFKLTVKTQNDKAVLSNVQVDSTSFIDSKGNPVSGPLLTNEKGEINTFFKGGNVTLKISGYADLEDWQQSYEIVNGKQYEYEALLTTANFKKWTSSTNIKLSSNINQLDVTCVGGGGGAGGGCGIHSSYGNPLSTGGGGAGGYCNVQEKVSFNVNEKYNIIIGAGGSAGATSNRNGTGGNGTDGGETSFIINALGGKGGNGGIASSYSYTASQASGGIGNGNGGAGAFYAPNSGSSPNGKPGQLGTVQGYSSFTETVLYGGGGGAGSYAAERKTVSGGGNSGGYGGAGGDASGGQYQGDQSGCYARNGNAGQDGFGGGGGSGAYAEWHAESGSMNLKTAVSSKGGSGCVAIRMHLKYT